MPSRRLSSILTPVMKFFVPVLMAGALCLVVLVKWLRPDGVQQGNMPPAASWLLLAGMALLFGVLLWRMAVPLKRVVLEDDALRVSNYVEEIRVPLVEVSSVSENRWSNDRLVTLTFACDTRFGRRVLFMPSKRMSGGWSAHPDIEALRQAIVRAQGAAVEARPGGPDRGARESFSRRGAG